MNNLETMAKEFGGMGGFIIFCIILLFFMCGLIRIFKITSLVNHNINKIYKNVKKYSENKNHADAKFMNQMSKNIKNNVWNEFCSNLIYSGTNGEKVYSNAPINIYFSEQTLAEEYASARFLHFLPSFLTGLGLFGTFLGLTCGLSNFTNISSSGNIDEAIRIMMSGASTAFTTSLWGIIFSLIIGVIDKFSWWRINSNLKELQIILSGLFDVASPEKALLSIDDMSKQMNETMGGLAEKIGNRMQEGLVEISDQMTKNLSEALEKLVDSTKTWGDRVTSSSEGVLENIVSKFIDKVGDAASSQKKLMDEASSKMSMIIENMDSLLKSYSNSALESFNEFKQNNIDSINNYNEKLTKISTNVFEMQSKHSNEVSLLIENSINNYNEKLTEISNNVFETQEKNSHAISSLIDKCDAVANKFAEELGNLKDNISLSNNKISLIVHSLTTASEKLEDSSDKIEKTGKIFEEASNKLTKPINETVNVLEGIFMKNVNLYENISKVSDSLKDICTESEDLINTVNELMSQSNNSFNTLTKQQKDFLSEMKNTVNELHEDTKIKFENYTKSIVNQTDARLMEWNQKTSEFANQMVNAVRAIKDVTDDTQSITKIISDNLNKIILK